jgi:hypothetical protein
MTCRVQACTASERDRAHVAAAPCMGERIHGVHRSGDVFPAPTSPGRPRRGRGDKEAGEQEKPELRAGASAHEERAEHCRCGPLIATVLGEE